MHCFLASISHSEIFCAQNNFSFLSLLHWWKREQLPQMHFSKLSSVFFGFIIIIIRNYLLYIILLFGNMLVVELVSASGAGKDDTGEIDGVLGYIIEDFLDFFIVFNFSPVGLSVFVAFTHPGAVGLRRKNQPHFGQKVHQISGDMLISVLMPQDHQRPDLVFDNYLVVNRVGVFQRI